MIAISTCWNYDPGMDLQAWLQSVKDIGFEAIELDYNFTREHLAQLPSLLKTLDLKVSSVHNFCPIPNDAPSPRHNSNYYRLSALDEEERAKAVVWTKSTVDTAVKLGAQAVVLHAGAVEFEDERSTALRDLFKQGKKDTPDYAVERERILRNRKERQAPHLAALDKSLEEILAYSRSCGRVLGFESRYYPLEIPNFEEVGSFLAKFHSQGLFYWHDMGHSQMNEKLGITPNLEFLNAYGDRLIGMHLHDMKGVKDHHPPFSGEIDWEPFRSFIQKVPLKVFEVKNATREEMKQALQFFTQKFL